MKLYNDQRDAQVFNLFIYLLLPYVSGLTFSPSSEAGVQIRQWVKSSGYDVSAFRMQLSQSPSRSPLLQINLSSFHPMTARTEDTGSNPFLQLAPDAGKTLRSLPDHFTP
jgi:hypothetical protein